MKARNEGPEAALPNGRPVTQTNKNHGVVFGNNNSIKSWEPSRKGEDQGTLTRMPNN